MLRRRLSRKGISLEKCNKGSLFRFGTSGCVEVRELVLIDERGAKQREPRGPGAPLPSGALGWCAAQLRRTVDAAIRAGMDRGLGCAAFVPEG
jgi:hypothetical protein